ncbi:methyltransferase domain-containing protein [Planctomicrobium sp.]|jgi:SAM-dependent methyltransferase|nr:class I SAM-dependent methyltransferase [Planctomicrobium sp.]MBT5019451.1 methyltransferase domain-containing protein [Planctomicrobium sp.]MDB4733681.1 methyltransferase domain-containing protein [Planctomicrobium sp.]
MVQLTDLAHQIVAEHLRTGDIAIDATCGNGHDTLFLSQAVGDSGAVIACDVQQSAINATRLRCEGQKNIQYHCGDHAEALRSLAEQYKAEVAAVMFNLGYLPGGDKTKTTSLASTVAALKSSLVLMRPAGIISVLAYIGHPGGQAEETAVNEKFNSWSHSGKIEILHRPDSQLSDRSPRLYIGKKI